MITYQTYRSFLEQLAESGVQSRPVCDIRSCDVQRSALYIKHDVEKNISKALIAAKIEASLGHHCTYYFQHDLIWEPNWREILLEIQGMGHEVSYHYDVLDSADGDWDKANAEFARNLGDFEKIGIILKTVCPHGNPTKNRNGWNSNKDFFRNTGVRKRYPSLIDVVVDFDELLTEGTYISDAGFKFRKIGGISGNDVNNTTAMNDGVEIAMSELTTAISCASGTVLSIHTHRMQSSSVKLFLSTTTFKILKRTYLWAKRIPFVGSLASRFYSISRNV